MKESKKLTPEEMRERQRGYNKKYYLKNREKILEHNKTRQHEYYLKNRERILEQQKLYYRRECKRKCSMPKTCETPLPPPVVSPMPKEKTEENLPPKFYQAFYTAAVENLQVSTIKKLERIAKKKSGLPFEPARFAFFLPGKNEDF